MGSRPELSAIELFPKTVFDCTEVLCSNRFTASKKTNLLPDQSEPATHGKVQEQRRIIVVDDDPAVRDSLASVLTAYGYGVVAFESGDQVMSAGALDGDCLLLDLQMPGMSGLDVLMGLQSRDRLPPTIVLTGHGTIAAAVEAMKLGAVDFLEKPYKVEDLLAALRRAAAAGTGAVDRQSSSKVQELSPRRRDILRGLMRGQPNKVIAYELGLSVRTVEHYRRDLMNQLGVKTLPELVRIGVAAGM